MYLSALKAVSRNSVAFNEKLLRGFCWSKFARRWRTCLHFLQFFSMRTFFLTSFILLAWLHLKGGFGEASHLIFAVGFRALPKWCHGSNWLPGNFYLYACIRWRLYVNLNLFLNQTMLQQRNRLSFGHLNACFSHFFLIVPSYFFWKQYLFNFFGVLLLFFWSTIP